ncbi:MAG: succinate dehydrogenase flavoprotein subunit [Candidatus Marinimicrobia bacterium]|nr:succinate dehydrogenase flavoprotein subunit [Candidatus Neomarinimicrobiota bacterium]
MIHKFDAIIVGAGGAGLRCALELSQQNYNVAVLSKLYPVRSHTGAAQGGIGAALGNEEPDSPEWHFFDTIKGSDYLGDQDVTQIMCEEAVEAVLELEHLGLPFDRTKDGKIAQRAFGGHTRDFGKAPVKRAAYAADRTGHMILHTLFEQCVKNQVRFFNEFYVLDLIMDDDTVGPEAHDKTCRGVVAYELATGELHIFQSKATFLGTGGYGRVFSITSNAHALTGDGMAIVFRRGIPLEDMEFVQFHPTGLRKLGILVSEAARGEGGILRNRDDLANIGSGKDGFMAQVAPTVKDLAPRDMVSRAIYNEIAAGRGIEGTGDTGSDYVYLDLVHLGAEVINKKLPDISHFARKYLAVEPITDPIPVQPTAHYAMGGVPTDVNGRVLMNVQNDPVLGLYAAGEVACVSVHGANRLGTNSLLDIVVFGRRAGKDMVRYLQGAEFGRITDEPDAFIIAEIDRLQKGGGQEKVADLRKAMQKVMMAKSGVYRIEAKMIEARDTILELRQRYKGVGVADQSSYFNTELVEAIELGFLLDVAWTITESALQRKESRGAHSRVDFPDRDDKNWLKHTFIHYLEDGKVTFDYKPVTITKFKPKPRVY